MHDDAKITRILDAAGVRAGSRVLDVGCGTGVLVPDYLARTVGSVTAVDLSPRMIEQAKRKCADPRVTFLCADAETLPQGRAFDAVVIYNAWPHFPDPDRLIACLAGMLAAGGRLTVAHGMGRAQLDRHHAGAAHAVSRGLESVSALAARLTPYFQVDTEISEKGIYIVSGALR